MRLTRRTMVATLGAAVASPYVWVPKIAIAKDRRGGLVESVEVYSNLTQLASLNRYPPDLESGSITAGIKNASIVSSATTLSNRGFSRNRETGCEIRHNPETGHLTYLAFHETYQNGCLPFFNDAYSDDSYVTSVQGPNAVCLSVVAENIYTERKSKDLCRDLLYPRYSSAESVITFEECDPVHIEDRLMSALGIVVLKYHCEKRYAIATIYSRENEAKIYEVHCEYDI